MGSITIGFVSIPIRLNLNIEVQSFFPTKSMDGLLVGSSHLVGPLEPRATDFTLLVNTLQKLDRCAMASTSEGPRVLCPTKRFLAMHSVGEDLLDQTVASVTADPFQQELVEKLVEAMSVDTFVPFKHRPSSGPRPIIVDLTEALKMSVVEATK